MGLWILALALTCAALPANAWAGTTYDATEEIAAIQAEIAAHGYGWTAGETDPMRVPPAERYRWLGGRPSPDEAPAAAAAGGTRGSRDLPAIWDWRQHGGVTAARNQSACGSCWAFAAVAAFESALRVATGVVVNLSEQQVLSCNEVGFGCGGGFLESALEVLSKHAAISEACMPYQMDDEIPCEYECPFVAYSDGYATVPGDVESLKQSLYRSPLAVAMHVYDDFFAYNGGCYEHAGDDPINHFLLLAGWDDTACGGAGAWIVKNSWGRNWGIDGFAYIRYGSCRIGEYAREVLYSTNQPIFLYHEPLTDMVDPTEPCRVIVTLAARDAPLDAGGLRLHYRIEGDPSWTEIPLTRASDDLPGTYDARIPLPFAPAAVEYWLEAADLLGNRRVDPPNAPQQVHGFYIQYNRDCFRDEMEGWEPDGWSVSAPDDDAVTGRWEKGDPEGTRIGSYSCNPSFDHTQYGTWCYCTGLDAGFNASSNDVNGGKTTLTSPRIDVSWAAEVRLDYYRWFSNGALPPADDYWQVDVSADDGATWIPLEYTLDDDPGWVLRSYDLNSYIDLTEDVRLRFIASDTGALSIVEAALDDILLVATDWEFVPSSVVNEPVVQRIRLESLPNPSTGASTLRFSLPSPRSGWLRIVSPDGRCLRRIALDAAGSRMQSLFWDGRDDEGRPVASGVYFLRLPGGDAPVTRLVVLR